MTAQLGMGFTADTQGVASRVERSIARWVIGGAA